MAAHRKPSRRSLGGSSARTAFTIALAGAATATAFDGTGQAAPDLTPAQVKAKVDKLYQEAEVATEKNSTLIFPIPVELLEGYFRNRGG